MIQSTINFDAPPRDPNVDARDVKRITGQNAKILERLRAGPATNAELATFCLNSRARISDLRAVGHVIKCERKEGGLSVYRLMEDRPGNGG